MLARVRNPNHPKFRRYGGRGIAVCDSWLSFENFTYDMGPCPTGYTLERINNNGDYEPQNCRWATRTDQANNQSSSVRLVCHGETRTMAEWSRITNVPRGTIRKRLARGLTVEQALNPSL
jgi:hypothetical protein